MTIDGRRVVFRRTGLVLGLTGLIGVGRALPAVHKRITDPMLAQIAISPREWAAYILPAVLLLVGFGMLVVSSRIGRSIR